MAINTCNMKLLAQTGVGASLLLHTSGIVVVGDIQSFSIPFFFITGPFVVIDVVFSSCGW